MCEDIQFAMKCFIEGLLNPNSLSYLGINDIDIYSRLPSPIIHHLVLLLCSSQCLHTLNLSGRLSKKLFANPRAMLLFCEALKYSKLVQLFLDGCNINNQLLQLLVPALTDSKGYIFQIIQLDICWNTYTSAGLTQFLRTLTDRAHHCRLLTLATNEVTNEHRSWVQKFNTARKQGLPFFAYLGELYIGFKGDHLHRGLHQMHFLCFYCSSCCPLLCCH